MGSITIEKKGNNTDIDEGIFEQAIKNLMQEKISISSAESCTGGMFASIITDFSGVSSIFDRGIITYSNEAKASELGVMPETLKMHGAVSAETAYEMAEGIKRVSNTDLGISVTGIAGPTGGSEAKPVGLVYIGLVYKDFAIVRELRLSGNRQENRKNSVKNMFEMINEILNNKA